MDDTAEKDLKIYFRGKKVTLEQRLRKDRLNFIGATETGEKCFVKLSPKEIQGLIKEKEAPELIVDTGGHPNVLSEFNSGKANGELVYLAFPFDSISERTLK